MAEECLEAKRIAFECCESSESAIPSVLVGGVSVVTGNSSGVKDVGGSTYSGRPLASNFPESSSSAVVDTPVPSRRIIAEERHTCGHVAWEHCCRDTRRGEFLRILPGLPDKLVKERIFPLLPVSPSLLWRLRRVCRLWRRHIGDTFVWQALEIVRIDNQGYRRLVSRGEVQRLSLQERFEFEMLFLRFCLKWGDAPYGTKRFYQNRRERLVSALEWQDETLESKTEFVSVKVSGGR